ncbi:sigma-70 family RNA polymerase sigma factor [Actinosynnema sp. NPDC047251]|uniref:RNA polymerase, sigma-24 subunit, ECF subfamily n=1 Tax=Saccharothrix espanaensis (strain ATCC 51144 / DSM 44229 / JCM 9112 / NBRC 15066 / NRRL 15764) TaxID=1179773 RepID=K0JRI7_SACES|nr:sigma-70 family RNA polymerase sigma factor [Saccharothrix espanaensis]CCH27409.1 RNA polymerase, sigma-24 subunit, ECF subfamily [Saccharothrix espanaensis DSM 44229]
MAGDADFDRELLARVRSGDDSAFGELFSRHADAVRRFALRHVREHAEADDLTAEAFFRVLQAIRRGTGPTDHVRTYLLTVARRVAWEWSGRRRDVPVEDEELSRRVEPFPDATAARPEHALISRAFTSLPERWRTVLWQVEVEGERPAAVAPSFGLSPNAMAALARRAREGLRAAYLQAHLAEDVGPRACSSVVAKLGNYTAGGVQGAEQRRIRKHLQTCSSCNSLHAELTEVCSTLRAHAASIAVPVAATALFGTAALGQAVLGQAALGKAAWLTGRVKLALAASASAVAVGLFGVIAGSFTGAPGPALVDASPDTPNGSDVLELRSTAPTVTGWPTSETSPEPPPAREQVEHTRAAVRATTTQPAKPATTTTRASEAGSVSAPATTTRELRLFQEPVDDTQTSATTTSETPTALVETTTTTPATPTVTPTTVTLHPTPSALEPS